MAHRKNPSALRRSRRLSNPVFCIYTRKDHTIKSWTNRLKRLQMANNCTKSRLKMKSVRSLVQKNKKNAGKKKNVLKLTSAVIYSSHFSNTIYPLFSKAVSFQTKKFLKKQKTKSIYFFL